MTGERVKVLLVEDNPGDRRLLASLLEEAHPGRFELVSAAALAEGIALACPSAVDTVLLDLGLPDSQGLDTLRRMRAAAPALPIVISTGSDDEELASSALREGAQDYLVKGQGDGLVVARAIRYAIERKRFEELLRRAHDELETRVRERTAELNQANAALRQEVAERTLAEQRLEASLAEKEVLLREVHHRVKNNLQIVASLLNLQAESVTHAEDRFPLLESQNRVRTIALIHEKLYGSGDLAGLRFDGYVTDLVAHIRSSFSDAAHQVAVELDLEELRLEIGTAIPLALILNELLVNALRHAFPDRRPGRVAVGLRRLGEGRCELRVADDGVGLPAGLDVANARSMGLQIVSVLARQLDGTLELGGGEGATFRLDFPFANDSRPDGAENRELPLAP